MVKIVKKIISLVLASLFLFSIKPVISLETLDVNEDLDPLVDITVTVKIQKIRSLEKLDLANDKIGWIDFFGKPDFYVKVFINNQEFKSPIWKNTRYVNDPDWSATLNVPDDEENVQIKIQLWDWNLGLDRLCDISGEYYDVLTDNFDVDLTYNIKTGHWSGEDYTNNEHIYSDPSGYGRLNGCDDGSVYQKDRDCELWFDIYQNDYDGDTIPYWTEVNVFGTDPEVDNRGEDADEDGVPIEWEYKWGYYYQLRHESFYWYYDPFVWDDHKNIDVDGDSLTNYEEYLTSQWGSDPFRRDLFIELDQMEESPDGQKCILPEAAKELLRTAHDRQNIVYHLDDGTWEETGSEMIPFAESITQNQLQQVYYWNYFLHRDNNNWRKGVFHYGIVVNDAGFPGYCFRGNAFQISSSLIEDNPKRKLLDMNICYASVFMHETGHTFGFDPIPGHNTDSYYPWQPGWWKCAPYVSCMNYRYCYRMVDFSNGSNGKNDFNDWVRMDFNYFDRYSG